MKKSDNKNSSALFQAIGRVQEEAGRVLKDGKNPYFKSSYTTLNAVLAVLKPLWDKHGITVTQWVSHQERVPMLVTDVTHPETGTWVTSPCPLPCKYQTDPQALGSSITYMRRYCLKAIFAMEDTDDDGEAGSGRPGRPESGVANQDVPPGFPPPGSVSPPEKKDPSKPARDAGFNVWCDWFKTRILEFTNKSDMNQFIRDHTQEMTIKLNADGKKYIKDLINERRKKLGD